MRKMRAQRHLARNDQHPTTLPASLAGRHVCLAWRLLPHSYTQTITGLPGFCISPPVVLSGERHMAIRSLFLGNCLLIAASASAAPPPGADMSLAPWFRSLRVPGTNNMCCDDADCRHYPVRSDGAHYQVFFDDRWLVVPPQAVSDRIDNPTGDYVTCIQRDHWTSGEPDGPRVLCLFKAPRT